MPIDAIHQAREQWAQYNQGTMQDYIYEFCQVLLHIQYAAPAEILDHFICILAVSIHAQVLA